MTAQDKYDDAMFDYSNAEYAVAVVKLLALLELEPDHFDAQLALGMAHYRLGDFTKAIEEGHKAEKLKPHEQLVHTNLSLFYMKAGDKKVAEHHGLQARIASWRLPVPDPAAAPAQDPELQMAKAPMPKLPPKFPDQPWKKKSPDAPQNPA